MVIERDSREGERPQLEAIGLLVVVVACGVGGSLYLMDHVDAANAVWAAVTGVGLIAATGLVVTSLRRRWMSADIIAVLALGAALLSSEFFAGALITVMLGTGRLLEARADRRARRELSALVARVPRVAHRQVRDTLETVELESVVPGDLLVVTTGEVVPVDGRVEADRAVLDESALTGESRPVVREVGALVRSGVVNAGGPFRLRATQRASDSTYSQIVRIADAASAERSPAVRLADRFAVVLVPVTIIVAAGAWALSGSGTRAVAVLVVATPCPLILAVPIAVVAALSNCARIGVVVKDGGTLERLARGEILLMDKTGTMTRGEPELREVLLAPAASVDRMGLLTAAASLDQMSPHVLASAIVAAAHAERRTLTLPHDVFEETGLGISGRVGDTRVRIGRASWATPTASPAWLHSVRRRAELDDATAVYVSLDDRPGGAFLFTDPVRFDAARTIRRLRAGGIRRIVMLTGDRGVTAGVVANAVGIDEFMAECTPLDKVERVRLERLDGVTIMVGDGVNDAPALALADVGVAIGAAGSTAASESADVVLTVDRLDRLSDARSIARLGLRRARESAAFGIGMSMIAMGFAAAGMLQPVAGALLQELIDVVVILNALRMTVARSDAVQLVGEDAVVSRRFSAEHERLRGGLDRIRTAADALGEHPTTDQLSNVRAVEQFLVDEILPHEAAEDAELYPAVGRAIGGVDPTGTMSRGHAEIAHLVRRLTRLLEAPDPEFDTFDVVELRHTLYGLDAILRLHFAQEDEAFLSMAPVEPTDAR